MAEIKKNKNTEKKNKGKEKLAIIRIRGSVGIKKEIKDTLKMLKLFKKNWCVIVDKNDANIGMAKKVKDYATYGEIDKETLNKLMKNSGKDKKGKLKPFKLSPPKGGFERKGIKFSFSIGGALGYRGKKINDLIKKMM